MVDEYAFTRKAVCMTFKIPEVPFPTIFGFTDDLTLCSYNLKIKSVHLCSQLHLRCNIGETHKLDILFTNF